MATFTWIPSYGSGLQHAPSINKAQFGDGYAQRAADGINADLKRWQITFQHRTKTEADAIDAFLITQGGVTAFDWTDLDGDALSYVCEGWAKIADTYDSYTITCQFDQVP